MVVNDADLTGLKPDVMWPPCRVVISVMVARRNHMAITSFLFVYKLIVVQNLLKS